MTRSHEQVLLVANQTLLVTKTARNDANSVIILMQRTAASGERSATMIIAVPSAANPGMGRWLVLTAGNLKKQAKLTSNEKEFFEEYFLTC